MFINLRIEIEIQKEQTSVEWHALRSLLVHIDF